MFENDLFTFNGSPADVRRMIDATTGLRRSPSSRSATSKACPPALRERASSRGRAQVRRHGGAGLRSADGLHQRLARQPGRHRPRRRRPARTRRACRRAAACGSPSRRWPGAGTSTTTATPGRRCAAPIIRPSAWCSIPSTSWRAARTSPPSAPSRATASFLVQVADAPQAGDGLPVVEPALPQFPGPGRLAPRSTSWRRWRPPASTAVLAGDLQRPVPQRLGAAGRGRRPSLADLPARPAARAFRPNRRRPDTDAAARAVRSASSSSSSRLDDQAAVGFETPAAWPGLPSRRPSISPSRSRDGARARSTSS